MAIHEMMESMAQKLGAAAHVGNVYGEPVRSGDKTIIPVASVAYGFGGGSGSAEAREGGGGGGGMRAHPAGVIEITNAGTRFVPVTQAKPLAVAALGGFLLGFLYARRR